MPRSKSSEIARGRVMSEGFVPELSVEGTAYEAGRQLGAAWREALRLKASLAANDSGPWWKQRSYAKLISRRASYLPDLYRGMADGAGIKEERVGMCILNDTSGCTSFAFAPRATLDGRPVSGQTKDVSKFRAMQLAVLRLRLTDGAPSALTMTYQGELFGHGFVTGGCAIFRNSLFTGAAGGATPYEVWGLLALHCRSVEEVMKLTRDYPVDQSFHTTVSDEQGNIIGIEYGPTGSAFLKPKRGIYVHANAVVSGKRLMKYETDQTYFRRAESLNRENCLRQRLVSNYGRLTAQLAFSGLADHGGYPVSVCRHQATEAMTGAAVIAEPTKGLLHVVRGPVCQNWPRTYRL